jgi:RNA-directed DNA polymerase
VELGRTGGVERVDVLSGLDRRAPVRGSPQGAVLSPLLAHPYLHGLDRAMSTWGYRMVRYADDFVILCATREQAQEALARVRRRVEAAGLSLHPDKIKVGDPHVRFGGRGGAILPYPYQNIRIFMVIPGRSCTIVGGLF